MSQDVSKGLDMKQDERETSCTAGDELYCGGRVVPREMSYAAGDETYRGRWVGSRRHGKTEWGKGLPLTISNCFQMKKIEIRDPTKPELFYI